MADYQNQSAYNTQTATGADAHAIDEGLRAYMLRVYNYMALGIAFTAIVTLALPTVLPGVYNAITAGGFWVLFIGILGMGFFAERLILTGSTLLAQASFWVYAALWGGAIAPMVNKYLQVNPDIVIQAFAITSITFGAVSVFGYVTKKDLSAFGTFFVMGTIGLLIAIVLNALIFKSTMFSLITSFAVVLLFSAITAWETQQIKESYFVGDNEKTATGKAIFGAFLLYGSFVTLFIHILNILGIMGGDD